jgi:hypothetical protein
MYKVELRKLKFNVNKESIIFNGIGRCDTNQYLVEVLTKLNLDVKERKIEEYNKGNFDYSECVYDLSKSLIKSNMTKLSSDYFSAYTDERTNDIVSDILLIGNDYDVSKELRFLKGLKFTVVSQKYETYQYKTLVLVDTPMRTYYIEVKSTVPSVGEVFDF